MKKWALSIAVTARLIGTYSMQQRLRKQSLKLKRGYNDEEFYHVMKRPVMVKTVLQELVYIEKVLSRKIYSNG